MPSFDSSRGRFKLADRHLAVFSHLLDKETPPAELRHSLGELQQIGLVGPEGELSPLLREFLTTLASPLVMIQAEVTGQHGPLAHGLVVGQDAVFSHDAWPGEEESEYVPIEPQTLVWEMARKVKLRRGERDGSGIAGVSENAQVTDSAQVTENARVSEITTTMGALDAVFAALEGVSDETADLRAVGVAALSAASDLAEPELTALVDLTLSLDATWRMTTAWGAEGAQSVRSIAVWDCGDQGHWLRVQPEEPIEEGQVGPESTLRLVRSNAGEVWDKLVDLLPDKADLVAAGAAS
ncbi:hypothetical protein ABT039_06235 [Streptomyces lasiicapitis]|uniref:Uncharacterized protein n=1 Tax=Streptomyces lasiicapitis TaxID=1923961 RepID=A0ABQ2MMR3_9ACTN|nr:MULTISPECIES: hypothetical protein [Streptomyces]QIB44227.1 hypothetical protein G3H79_15155 [Streptomyces aureoverticillatus]GGO52992.1 hypothetical protein GCM10012286_59310 [Streptomyces lasiicapitis]